MPDRGADSGGMRLLAADAGSLDAAATAMLAGAIVGLPTETVYGVGVLPRPDALAALVAAKRRDEGKGIPLLIDDLTQIEGLLLVSDAAHRLAGRFWPGPLTLALPLRGSAGPLSPLLTGGRDSLAVRLPDHPIPRALARQLGPIAVTSANRSGMPEAHTADELLDALGESIALVLDDGPVRGGVPSSVVAVDAHGRMVVVREGAIRRAELEATLAGSSSAAP